MRKWLAILHTGRNFTAADATTLGLVSRVLPSVEEVHAASISLAEKIAQQSPVAVFGTKVRRKGWFLSLSSLRQSMIALQVNILHSRDRSVADGLDYMTTWNMAALQSKDLAAVRHRSQTHFLKFSSN
jgi:enoyl-CoA hydratase/carnithine racemase